MNQLQRLIFPLTFALALFAASMQVGAVPSQSSESDDSASSGRAVSVMATTRIEYVSALRVWYDAAGTLLVCRAPGEPYTHSSKRCEIAQSKNVQAGWTALPNLQLTGYTLNAVQVNETKNGPSLVLYWRATPVKTLKP